MDRDIAIFATSHAMSLLSWISETRQDTRLIVPNENSKEKEEGMDDDGPKRKQ